MLWTITNYYWLEICVLEAGNLKSNIKFIHFVHKKWKMELKPVLINIKWNLDKNNDLWSNKLEIIFQYQWLSKKHLNKKGGGKVNDIW